MPSLMDLFAECDSCGGREFEGLGSELICIECGMAFVAVAAPADVIVESASTKDAARAA